MTVYPSAEGRRPRIFRTEYNPTPFLCGLYGHYYNNNPYSSHYRFFSYSYMQKDQELKYALDIRPYNSGRLYMESVFLSEKFYALCLLRPFPVPKAA